jgi:hypothetical protein
MTDHEHLRMDGIASSPYRSSEKQGLLATNPSSPITPFLKWSRKHSHTTSDGLDSSDITRESEDTLVTSSVAGYDFEDFDDSASADRLVPAVRDTSGDLGLFEDIWRSVSTEAGENDSAILHGLGLISSTVSANFGRDHLLELKGTDARGLLQVIQKVR